MTALQRQWYAKLKASGFEDIETGDNNEGLLKTDKRIEPERVVEYEASAEYYQRAGQFLHARDWPDDWEREIWELHAGGVGQNEIARRTHRGNTLVNETIVTLRAEMLRKGAGREGRKPRNGRAFLSWLEREARKLNDADLIAMAPTLLELARSMVPSMRNRCSTK